MSPSFLKSNMEHFKSTLIANNYSPSTIARYVHRLKSSGVNLQNRRVVHRYLASRRLEQDGDVHGETFRAYLLYDRFLHNAKLPGGRVYHPSPLTIGDACLRQKSRADVAKVWWLHQRGYTPNVACTYVRNSSRNPGSDRHRDLYRARCALEKFNWNDVFITDKVVRDHFHAL